MADAHRRAEAVIDVARSRAHESARETEAAALARAHAEALSIRAAARAVEADVVKGAVDVVVSAARAVAERVIAVRLADDDEALVAWARQAIGALLGGRRIVVRASEATVGRLSHAIATLSPSPRDAVELIADESVPDGALAARCAVGEATVDVHTQVDALIAALRGDIAAAVVERARNA